MLRTYLAGLLVTSCLTLFVVACGGSNPTTATAPPATSPSDPGAANPPPPGGASVTLAGFVPGAIPPTGACPAIRFGVESKSTGAYIDTVITADSTTQYSGGTCADVTLGVLLEVTGNQQADKSVRALLVKFTPKGVPVLAPR